PLYLVLDAFAKVEDRIEALDAREAEAHGEDVPWEETLDYRFARARGGLFDTYLTVQDGQLADRKLRALLITGLGYVRDRWAYELAEGSLSTMGQRMTEDAIEAVESPALAGALGMLETLSDNDAVMATFNRFGRFLLGSEGGEGQLRAIAAG